MRGHPPIRGTGSRARQGIPGLGLAVLLCLAVACGTVGCRSEPTVPLAGADLEPCPGEAATAAPMVTGAVPEQARVYIDGSASMQGFAGQGGLFGRLLHELRPALLALDVEYSSVWRVGARPERVVHRGNFDRYDDQGFYTLGETDLAGALAQELVEPTPGLALVISDGVMSLRQDAGEEGELAECARGSDVHCLGLRVGELVAAGRGFWIVGLRSPFRGTLFSEQAAPGGRAVGTVDLADRPFYLWILADDPLVARRLIASLWERLGLASDGSEAFALEVAPGRIPALLPDGAPPVPDRDLLPPDASSGAVMGRVVHRSGQAPRQEILDRGLSGTALGLGFGVNPSPLAEFPQILRPFADYQPLLCLRWQEMPGQVKARIDRREDRVLLSLQVPDFEPLAGGRAALLQRLERREHEALPGLDAWSTDDDRTVEAGGRTLHLGEFLRVLDHRVALPAAYEQPLVVLEFDPSSGERQ